MAFAAGLIMAAGPVRAQEAPKIYNTPGAESTAHPLFLQRLFGGAGSNAGLGKAKPYDFSTQRYIRQETQDWRELADKFRGNQSQIRRMVIADRQKAIADMYAQFHAELKQDEMKRRQDELQVQAQIKASQQQVRVPVIYKTGPSEKHARREKRPARPATTYQAPVYYNGRQVQPNSGHAPIFLH